MNEKVEFGVLTLISTSKIRPHPNNPRKDVGDVSELAESIKANGILQNLTVVPIYGEITGELTGQYTVVIGHRRLAAAKLAGLEKVPCVVSDMTGVAQIRTMLTENMQRTDLTVYEQAQGFQMMLDLGDTVDQIAERAGFSTTTVRRRVKLLELDKDKFKKAEKRGATLEDYIKLNDIEDPQVRNSVLDTIGTNNFQRSLQSALDDQKYKHKYEERLELIKTFATEDPDASFNTRKFVCNYGRWSVGEVKVPEDAGTVQYYYKSSGQDISIYIDKDAEKEKALQEEQAERRRKQDEEEAKYTSITCAHYDLRSAFVLHLSNATIKKNSKLVSAFLADVIYDMCEGGYGKSGLDVDGLIDAFGGREDVDEEDISFSEEPSIREAVEKSPEKLMFCLAYFSADDDSSGYWSSRWESGRYVYGYRENTMLDRVYEVLTELGYEISDDEAAMMNGTHELFKASDPSVGA